MAVQTPELQSFYLQVQFDREISESVQLSEEVAVLYVEISEAIVFSEEIDLTVTYCIDETVLISEEVEARIEPKTPILLSFWLNSTSVVPDERVYFSEEIEIWTDGPLSISESVRFSEQEIEVSHVVLVSEEIVFDETLWMRQTLVEELVFSEELLFEITRQIQESLPLFEELLSNPYTLEEIVWLDEVVTRKFPIPGISEEVKFGETVSPYTSLPIEEQFNLQENLELQIIRLNFDSIDFSEVTYQSRLSLDETLDLTEQARSQTIRNLSESFSFAEEVVRQVEIDETINFWEGVWNNHRRISESFKIQEYVELRVTGIRLKERITLSEEVDPWKNVVYPIDEIGLSEEVIWEWQLAPEPIVFSEVIYLSRLSLDETLKLIETIEINYREISEQLQLQEEIEWEWALKPESITLSEEVEWELELKSETIVFSETIWINYLEVSEQLELQEEVEYRVIGEQLFEEIALLENLELEIYIWIPQVITLGILESFVLREEEIETILQPGRIVSEEIFFSEEVELTRKVKPLVGGGADRGIPATPKPVVAKPPSRRAEAPPVAKPPSRRAKAPPVIKRAEPRVEPVPPPRRRLPPAVVPEAVAAIPAPPTVRVEKSKTRVVRMRVTDNTSRYRVK